MFSSSPLQVIPRITVILYKRNIEILEQIKHLRVNFE